MSNMMGEALMHLCCWGAALCGAALFAAKVVAPAWDEMRKFLSKQGIGAALIAPLVVCLVYVGSTKSVTFTDGLANRQGRTWATNDTIHIEWVRDTSHVVVPLSAAVYIDYRPSGSTNEWGMLGQAVVGDFAWEGTLADATNYDYHVWAYYVPPSPVHTNGVWIYRTLKDRTNKYPIPLRARVEINGKAIATPAEKRKDGE